MTTSSPPNDSRYVNPLMQAALAYAKKGWPVFPAHTVSASGCTCRRKDCDRIAKHPRTQNGLKDASLDERQIQQWWMKWPDANVCIRTGAGLVVVDIDPRHHGDENLAALERVHGQLPSTVECLTGGGGRHLFFKASGDPVQSSVDLVTRGVDIRADGGYVVAAPSKHESGRAYEWEVANHPDENELVELPAWLRTLATRRRAPAPSANGQDADKYITGARNKALTSLAGVMRKRNMGQAAIEASLLIENAQKCVPPLDEVEVRRIAASVSRYAPSEDPSADPAATTDAPWTFLRGDHLELAQATLARLETGPISHDEGDFWRYDAERGIWDRLDSEHVAFVASGFAGCPVMDGKKPKPLKINDASVKGAVSLTRTILVNHPERRRFIDSQYGVAFKNGFAIVEDGAVKLLPHSADHMCRYAFDVDYDPHAPATLLTEFFSELFADVNDEEGAGRESILQEFVGASLTGAATKYQKLLLINGLGGNGKSEFLKLARGLFPPNSVASVPPQLWGERFMSSRLVGVLANFVDEIPERDIAAGEVFKSVITGDPVAAERKNKDPFDFRPIAGHIFSANSLPGTVDQSDGYWRRFVICPFTRDFTKADTRRPDVALEILAKEFQGLAAWALDGAARLQRTGTYTTTETAMKVLAEWREEADPVRRFLAERKGPPYVGASALYDEWKSWAQANGFAAMSSTRFGRRVTATGLYVREHGNTGNSYRRAGSLISAMPETARRAPSGAAGQYPNRDPIEQLFPPPD